MRLSKTEHNARRNPLLKAKLWFGADKLDIMFKDVYFYFDEDTQFIYVYGA